MIKATVTLKIVSPCGTYKETMKCVSMEEANAYKAALEAEGSKVTISAQKSSAKQEAAAQAKLDVARSIVRGVLDATK